MSSTRWPALVIGGGPAGSSAAIALAQAGVATHLVERTANFDSTVCGAFLGADALAYLKRLGLDAFELGAQPITFVRLIDGRHVVETKLPFAAAGLSRGKLDEALIKAAEKAGARVTRGVSVQNACCNSRSAQLRDGQALYGDALFIATGKHELRGATRQTSPRDPGAIGLRAVLSPTPARRAALSGVVELHQFDGGYAGLLLLEDGAANLCVSVERWRLARAGSPTALFQQLMQQAPLLRERIQSDLPATISAVAGVPYGWREPSTAPGVFRLGDQGAVIASIAGDGIAMALASGHSAGEAFERGGPEAAEAWQRAWARKCRRPVMLAEAFRRAAQEPVIRSAAFRALQLLPSLGAAVARFTRIDRSFSGAALP